MHTPLIAAGAITISLSPEKVWDYLVNPEHTRKYMFNCAPITDWKVGNPLLWQGIWEGKEAVFVKGQVVAYEPHTVLAFSTIDPNNPATPDIPDNHTIVTYRLYALPDGGTRLEVTQGDFATVAEGQKRFKEVSEGGGWQSLLENIKKMAEAGA